MSTETQTINPTTLRSLIHQVIGLHKSLERQRELAKEVARSLPRDAIKMKTEVNRSLRAIAKGAELTPEQAVALLDTYRYAEQKLEAWRNDNKDLLSDLSTATTNAWTHIKALKVLGAQLPQLPEGGD
jgi:hypothetical protein